MCNGIGVKKRINSLALRNKNNSKHSNQMWSDHWYCIIRRLAQAQSAHNDDF